MPKQPRFFWKIEKECSWCFFIYTPKTVTGKYCSEDCCANASVHAARFGHVNYSTMPLCSCGRIATPPKDKRHYRQSQGRSKTCEICRAEKKKQVDINRASIKYRVRAEVMKRGERIQVDALVLRDGFDCQICHEPIDWSKRGSRRLSPSVDHIVPISKGGEHVYENCRMVHFGCNAKKGNR
jgi:5-methylcytosine-specific restriction endonuclease McrA